jgi:peptidoglycan hydrolase-like protein with peptidoglycan-binding domain
MGSSVYSIFAKIINGSDSVVRLLSAAGVSSREPQLQVDSSGNAIVIWSVGGAGSNIKAIRYTRSNDTWSTAVTISLNYANLSSMTPRLSMSTDGNFATAVWKYRDVGGTIDIIQAANYVTANFATNGGWAAPSLISADDRNNELPDVATDNLGNSIAVWRYSDATAGNRWVIKGTVYKQSGSWSARSVLSDPLYNSSNPKISIAKTTSTYLDAWAVWQISKTKSVIQSARFYSSTPSTLVGTWTDGIGGAAGSYGDLSDVAQNATIPQIAVDYTTTNSNNNAIAIWKRDNGASVDIIQAKYYTGTNSSTGGWTATAADISSNIRSSYAPKLAINTNNNALAVWPFETGVGSTRIINYSFFTKTSGWSAVGTGPAGDILGDVSLSFDNSDNAAASYTAGIVPAIVYVSRYTRSTNIWSDPISSPASSGLSQTGIDPLGATGGTTTTTTIPRSTTTTTSTTTIPGPPTTTTTIPPVVLLVDQAYVNNTTFPVTVPSNITSIKVVEDIVTNKLVNFVIQSGSSVIFNGQGHTITLNDVTNYPGLIKSSSNNTIVRNVGVLSTYSDLASSAGWIGSASFAGNIDTCYSDGDISAVSCGGIVGSNTIANITNCFSTGVIYGESSGGIAGTGAGSSRLCTITNCYSTGQNTGLYAGGIAGTYASRCHVTNCYTLCTASSSLNNGTIFGNLSGTLPGDDCKISNCYTAGLTQENNTVTSNTSTPTINTDINTVDGLVSRINQITQIVQQLAGTATNPTIQGYKFNNNLQVGSKGADVSALQTILIQSGLLVLPPGVSPGYFGPLTRAAVQAYQTANGIVGAGYVGSSTRASLNSKTGTPVVNSNTISGVGGYRVVLTTDISNYQSIGWNDAVAYSALDTAFFKVSPGGPDLPNGPDVQGINNVPFKLLAFLYSASTSQLSGPILTYSNIWSMASLVSVDSVTSAVITNNSGVTIPTKTGGYELSPDGRSITFNFSGQLTPVPRPYCLVINNNYVDKFELVSTTTIFFRLIGDFYAVIVDANSSSQFIQNTKTALATALGISEQLIQILDLSEGSIAVQALIPTPNVDALGNIIKSGQLTVQYDGKSYPAITDSFRIIDTTCFYRDTLILTPGGYRKVQDLSRGDLVKTAQGREVPIKRMISFTGTYEKCPLYVIQKDALAPNVPLQDLYMSDGHAFRNGGNWYHMKCSELASKVDLQSIEYYNIVLDNYIDNTLVANGVEVESLFDMKGLKMHWRCEEKCCKPVIEKQ